jgi:mannose-6-phosphate isomerase-like protein (cupin superfamily)
MKTKKMQLLCALLLVLTCRTMAQVNPANMPADYLKISIKHLLSQQKHTGKDSTTFLSENTMTGKLIHINKDEKFNDIAGFDLIYYVIEGKGKLKTGNNVSYLDKGSVVFVPRKVKSSFDEVTETLNVIELISLEDKGNGDSASASFSLNYLRTAKQPSKNIFKIFINGKSMLSGLYLLPKELKGDSAVYNHRFDEINLINSGSGKLLAGTKNLKINPGDIVYVRRGAQHSFNSLKQDMEILIFFEKRSVQR